MSVLQQDRDLITSFAESVGIKKLDREIEDLLLSDMESKLLEIIQESKKLMRHSHRDFLRVDDVKHAMSKLSIPVRSQASIFVRASSAIRPPYLTPTSV
jgi:histone H3/H4